MFCLYENVPKIDFRQKIEKFTDILANELNNSHTDTNKQ